MSYVRLDTVGTSFLEDDAGPLKIIYKGKGEMPRYDPSDFFGKVSLINIPLDGPTNNIARKFRKGRKNVVGEASMIAERVTAAGIPLGINTVVNSENISTLERMHSIVSSTQAKEWRLFQYDPDGPNPSGAKDRLQVSDTLFEDTTSTLRQYTDNSDLDVIIGGLENRGTYNMVNDAGVNYLRDCGIGELIVVGHITKDRDQVVAAQKAHIEEFQAL